jgi:hypothetical protein
MEGLRPNASTSCACRLNASKLYAIHVAKNISGEKRKKIFDKGQCHGRENHHHFPKKTELEITTMNEETERVSADLLATSVSKAVLAKEVLRLKQVFSIFM